MLMYWYESYKRFLFITECIDVKFGKGTVQSNIKVIRRKCNQKCIDIGHKWLKIKTENEAHGDKDKCTSCSVDQAHLKEVEK